jgi:hypothetical protein
MIEGVYYRSRLEDKIKIRKVIEEVPIPKTYINQPNEFGLYEINFE